MRGKRLMRWKKMFRLRVIFIIGRPRLRIEFVRNLWNVSFFETQFSVIGQRHRGCDFVLIGNCTWKYQWVVAGSYLYLPVSSRCSCLTLNYTMIYSSCEISVWIRACVRGILFVTWNAEEGEKNGWIDTDYVVVVVDITIPTLITAFTTPVTTTTASNQNYCRQA